jgi:2-polyprenyl-6-methoxyphenol hydroxylase-like FAD-dependent oxidoreductase
MRVLISGGGIAGPALAFWLRRTGAEVTIVERSPTPRPGGQTVDVRGIARLVVERMGLMETIKAARADERGLGLVDSRGRRLASMSAEAFGGEGFIAEIEIIRGELSQILNEAVAGDVDYRYGDKIDTLVQDAQGADVTFASGDGGRYDIVVGADGVHSGVRALAFGPDSEFVRPLGGYSGYFTVTDPGDLDHYALMHNAPGGRVALLRPLGGGRAMAGLSFLTQERVGRLSIAEQQRILTEKMTGVGWHVPRLLAEMPAATDFFFDDISQVHVDKWSAGRVVLLGDAGYCGSPLGGMGTSMSLVGAYVLAGELTLTGDPAVAFAAYQRVMADYVKAGTGLPPGGIGGFAPQGRLMIRLRALSFSMMTAWPMSAMMRKVANRAEAITLPDYEGLSTYAVG